MYSMSIEEMQKLARQGNRKGTVIPLSTELFADGYTTIGVLRQLREASKHCYLLESVDDRKQWGRYSFLGYEPSIEITTKDGLTTIEEEGRTRQESGAPNDVIRKVLARYKSIPVAGMPPFTGGLVGYFSYDYLAYGESSLSIGRQDKEDFKDLDLMLFDRVICFDNYRQKIILIANIATDDLEEGYRQATCNLEEMRKLLQTSGPKTKETSGHLLGPLIASKTKKEYVDMVEKAKHYIKEGDIFQVVLSNRRSAPFSGSLLDTYRYLRTSNPSPYMFYFSGSDVEMAGSSPETLVKLENGILHTFPLAGTRPRGKDEAEDAALEAELLSDEKELAEHNMLVDLGRNDLGRISKFGTVEVEKYLAIERFSCVMHIGSTVRGEIEDGKDALDALTAVLPAGTLSGAPKIRACQIIEELEHEKRGLYGGAIGYIGFSGAMDTCIAIRLAYRKNGKVFVQSGAGIVADSKGESEYNECRNKAKAITDAIEIASRGLS